MIESACVLASWFGMKHTRAATATATPGRIARAAAATKAAFAAAKNSNWSLIEVRPMVNRSVLNPATSPAKAPKKPYPGMRSQGTQPGPNVSPSPRSSRDPRCIP